MVSNRLQRLVGVVVGKLLVTRQKYIVYFNLIVLL